MITQQGITINTDLHGIRNQTYLHTNFHSATSHYIIQCKTQMSCFITLGPGTSFLQLTGKIKMTIFLFIFAMNKLFKGEEAKAIRRIGAVT